MTMGFLDRLFGKSKSAKSPPTGAGTMSLAQSLAQQGEALVAGRCDECRTTFIVSESRIDILSSKQPWFAIDIGGRCDRCGREICAAHLDYVKVDTSQMPGGEKIKGLAYGLRHKGCGGRIGGSGSRTITIVAIDAKDLESPRPKPAANVAAASGKFSLHKVILASGAGGVNMPNLICTQCFTLHPHPIPAAVLGFDAFEQSGYAVSAEDFEADVGGDCPTCGPICGKHAVPRLITMDGKRYLALHCARHGERLT
jgi:hypothetical protein